VGTDGAAVGGAAVVAVHWQSEAGQLGGIWLQVLVHHASVAVELMAMHGGAGVGGADVSQSSHSLQLAPQAHFSDQGFALTAHQDKQFGLGGVGVGTDGAAVGGAAVVAVHWQSEAGQLGGIWLQVLVHHASVAVELMAMHDGAGVGGADVTQSSHSLQLAPQAHFSDQGFALTAHQDKQFGLGGVGAGTAVDGAAVGGAAVVAVHLQCEAGQWEGMWLQLLMHHASVAIESMAVQTCCCAHQPHLTSLFPTKQNHALPCSLHSVVHVSPTDADGALPEPQPGA